MSRITCETAAQCEHIAEASQALMADAAVALLAVVVVFGAIVSAWRTHR